MEYGINKVRDLNFIRGKDKYKKKKKRLDHTKFLHPGKKINETFKRISISQ